MYIQGKETDDMILDVVKALWERHKRTEVIRKQMRLTKRCRRELEVILSLIGIDYSRIELCPIPVETEGKNNIDEKWRS